MGRPIPVLCAHSQCDNVRTIDAEGLTFTAQCCFEKHAHSQSVNQLWACCPEHKKSVLVDIMKDMPFSRLPHMKPQEAAALIS